MFGNQRFERDVGQNIAAVNNEWFFPKNAFDVLDAAAGFEQVWLVHKRNRQARILVRGKKSLKQFRMPVRVDDEPVHSRADQMIKRKCDERLLKNRDEGLGDFVGQWTQARAKSGG